MVVVPAGEFIMGSPDKEKLRGKSEGPQHRVTFAKPFSEIAISLLSEDHATDDGNDNPFNLTVPWSKMPHRRHRDVIVPEGSSPAEALPIRSDTRAKLVTALHVWPDYSRAWKGC
jgi:hypothetical protein